MSAQWVASQERCKGSFILARKWKWEWHHFKINVHIEQRPTDQRKKFAVTLTFAQYKWSFTTSCIACLTQSLSLESLGLSSATPWVYSCHVGVLGSPVFRFVFRVKNLVDGIRVNILVSVAGDGLGYRLLLGLPPRAEIGSRDPSLSLCNVNMFCLKQCSHEVWIPDPSPAM